MVVPGFTWPPTGLPKSSKPFVPVNLKLVPLLAGGSAVMIIWTLKDFNEYGYVFNPTTDAEAFQIQQLIASGVKFANQALTKGEAYNYFYRLNAYDKILNPP